MNLFSNTRITYLAVALFLGGIVFSIVLAPPHEFVGAPPFSVLLVSALFLLFHLALLPLVSELAAPAWARASGYGWIIFDNVLEMAALFGVGLGLILPLRWGIHIACATWIAGASSQQKGVKRWLGYGAAAALLGTTFAGPYLGELTAVVQTTGPAALLMALWLVLSARALRS